MASTSPIPAKDRMVGFKDTAVQIRRRSLVERVKHPETAKRDGVYSALGRVLVTRQCQTSKANTFTRALA